MSIAVEPSGAACGARVTGVDLKVADADQIAEIRRVWLQHQVLVFPDQELTNEDLVRITHHFGSVGDDPFFLPMEGEKHVVALTRRADEKAPVFAESWHTDWSFKAHPPIGTCLYSVTVPPVGGNTTFASQQAALAAMPKAMREKFEGLTALHCAATAYAPDGMYGPKDSENDRSMRIVTNESARNVHPHPLIVTHPESGEDTLYGTVGYIIGFEGMDKDASDELLMEMYQWQIRPEFQYDHHWEPGMFVLWDNRCVLHRANGGYDGYARDMRRTTVAGAPALCVP